MKKYIIVFNDFIYDEPIQLNLTMKNKQYILQEISCEQELEIFLRLRYNCFSKSAAGVFVTKNSNDIDLNYYDRNSNHYGLYLVQPNSKNQLVILE